MHLLYMSQTPVAHCILIELLRKILCSLYPIVFILFKCICLCVCFSIEFSVTLYDKLNELREKKQSLIDEMEKENQGTPAEERERLLKRVNPVSDEYQYFICHVI